MPSFTRHGRAPARALRSVPRTLWLALVLALGAQLVWHAAAPAPAARRDPIRPPPPASVLRLAALGEPGTVAVAGLLWLQFHDTQAGLAISWNELDYGAVRGWLARLLALAPASGYPLMLALHNYAQVTDPARQRIMLEFVRAAFVERPAARWRWLAEAALKAQYGLDDLDLALDYARTLAAHTAPGEIPHWARDLQILILEDMGAFESARILIGGLLASGAIRDEHEIRYLERKLTALKRQATPE